MFLALITKEKYIVQQVLQLYRKEAIDTVLPEKIDFTIPNKAKYVRFIFLGVDVLTNVSIVVDNRAKVLCSELYLYSLDGYLERRIGSNIFEVQENTKASLLLKSDIVQGELFYIIMEVLKL